MLEWTQWQVNGNGPSDAWWSWCPVGPGGPNVMGDPACHGYWRYNWLYRSSRWWSTNAQWEVIMGLDQLGMLLNIKVIMLRFTVKTYAGDSSELASIVTNKFSDLKGRQFNVGC